MNTRPTRAVGAIVALGIGLAAAPRLAAAGTEGTDTTVPSDTTTEAGPQGPSCSSIPLEGEGSFDGMADDPVATAASNNPYLTTLASAVQAAGLVDTLNGEGPFTVFAPSNEAFAAVPPADLDAILADLDQLTTILTYHVVAGESLSLDDLVAAGTVTTVGGAELTFVTAPDGSVSINGGAATITCSNITTANATVHVIDTVLIPPTPLVEVL